MSSRYVKPEVFQALTGYTVRAVELKIERGVWLEGREYKKAPDGKNLVDIQGYERWVEGRRHPG